MTTKVKETIVDGLYRYVLEWQGWGIMQDFPTQQDHDVIKKKFKEEIELEIERKKNEIHIEGGQDRIK